ncbi:MAG: hypothetical protein ACFFCS_12080 [Candidatus Hodarchaeota archaeon]
MNSSRKKIARSILFLMFLASFLNLCINFSNIQPCSASYTETTSGTFPIATQKPLGRPYGISTHFRGELENESAPQSTEFAKCEFAWTRVCHYFWRFLELGENNFSVVHDQTNFLNTYPDRLWQINTTMLPLLQEAPDWLLVDQPHWYIPPENLSLWIRYINETVTEFQGDMPIWEIINEPNNIWGVETGSWEEYFAVLIAAAETIKLVNDSLDVLVGGLGGRDELAFLEALMHNLTNTPTSVPGYQTAKDLFCGIAFHPYTNPPEELTAKLSSYDNVLRKYNWTTQDGARHWITEIGGETDHPKDGAGGFLLDPQREFAAMMIKQIAIATSWGVDGFNVWTYRDYAPPGEFTGEFAHCGIFYVDMTWKPAAFAFNWTNHLLGNGFVDLMPVTFPNGITGIVGKDQRLFNGNERWIIIAWNPNHQGKIMTNIQFGSQIQDARVFDYGSNDSTALDARGSESLQMDIGYEPLLLVVDALPGGTCQFTVVFDGLGTAFIGILVASLALVVITHAFILRKGKGKRDGD